MIETLFALFIAAVLLVLAFWIGGMIIDRLPVGDPVKNVFRIVGLLILLVIVVGVMISFLPGNQPLWFRRG